MVPYEIVKGPNGDAWVRAHGKDYSPAADQRLHPAEAEAGRRGAPGREGREGGDHRPGLLQRRPAPGHQGRRQDRRPRSAAHHQRADRGGAGLWPRKERRQEDRRLRPRRRHLRHLDPGDRRRRLRGEGDQRRHLPRRRGLRPAPRRLPGRRVQEGAGRRPAQGQAGAAAPEGRGREGQEGALHHRPVRGEPALHLDEREGPAAPQHQAHPRQAGSAGRGPDRSRPSGPATRR